MHGSGLAVGSATRSRSWAEPLGSTLERDRDTLALSRMWAAELLVAAAREVVTEQRRAT